jgi:hypothetical protein
MRRTVPLVITFIVGTVLVLAEFVPHRPFGNLGDDFSLYFDIIAVFAFLLGGGNLIRVHVTKIKKKREDWLFSIVTLAGFVVMLAAGLLKIGNPGGIQGDVAAIGSLFNDLYMFIFTPLQASMFALLAFFVGSASYRAFRAKNKEATILLLAAFVILLGRTPLGLWVTEGLADTSLSFLQIPNLANWIMDVPNLAGQRAIMIGIALGVISMSLRVILGVERTYLGQDNE